MFVDKIDFLQELGVQHEDLNQVEVQVLVEYVNTEVQEENDRMLFSFLICEFMVLR